MSEFGLAPEEYIFYFCVVSVHLMRLVQAKVHTAAGQDEIFHWSLGLRQSFCCRKVRNMSG